MSYREVVLVFVLTATVAFAFPLSREVVEEPSLTEPATGESLEVWGEVGDNVDNYIPHLSLRLAPSEDMSRASFDLVLSYPKDEQWSIVSSTLLLGDREYPVNNLKPAGDNVWRFTGQDLSAEAQQTLTATNPSSLKVRVQVMDDRMRFSRSARIFTRETKPVLWALK